MRLTGANTGRVDVSEAASISTSIAERYATAIFEIAQENDNLAGLEASLTDLATTLEDSAELRNLIESPVISRTDQKGAIVAIAEKMKLVPVLRDTLALMADKRRLYVVPHLITALRALLAAQRNEVVADVTSAKALTKAQTEKLASTLTKNVGKTVTINATVDESLIGGLVVKVGSKMIDTSIRARLNSLQNAMKEVG
nr:F0F1 ATP synthase subunit delta [Pontibaca salina]